jgi:hypothetical protein
MDGLRRYWHDGRGKTSAERGLDERAPIEGNVRDQAIDFRLQHASLLDGR